MELNAPPVWGINCSIKQSPRNNDDALVADIVDVFTYFKIFFSVLVAIKSYLCLDRDREETDSFKYSKIWNF